MTVLNTHKDILDKLLLMEVGNDFVDGRPNRLNQLLEIDVFS